MTGDFWLRYMQWIMLVMKIMGFPLSKRKRKLIRSSSVHISWLFLCKIFSYVTMFTIQKRFSLFNFLFSIDYRHQQMCKIFFSADKLSSSWTVKIRHCADSGWSQRLLNLETTGWAGHFAWKAESRQHCLDSVCAQAGWCKEIWRLAFRSWVILCAKLCSTWWFNNHMWAFSGNWVSGYRNKMHGAI